MNGGTYSIPSGSGIVLAGTTPPLDTTAIQGGGIVIQCSGTGGVFQIATGHKLNMISAAITFNGGGSGNVFSGAGTLSQTTGSTINLNAGWTWGGSIIQSSLTGSTINFNTGSFIASITAFVGGATVNGMSGTGEGLRGSVPFSLN